MNQIYFSKLCIFGNNESGSNDCTFVFIAKMIDSDAALMDFKQENNYYQLFFVIEQLYCRKILQLDVCGYDDYEIFDASKTIAIIVSLHDLPSKSLNIVWEM